MARRKLPRLGKQPPRFNFFLNPYLDARFTTCPKCRGKTKQRKLPLLIHVGHKEPRVLNLNKTCRFCPRCDLLIAHKDELDQFVEQFITVFRFDEDPNDYLVLGTMDRADWARGMKEQLTIEDMLGSMHDFKNVWQFEPAHYGWGR